MSSVTFFFPYYEVSGVPVVFLRLAEFIADQCRTETYIVDFPAGYMARTRSKESSLRLLPFERGKELPIPADTVLFMQSTAPWRIPPELRIAPLTKVVFWTLHQMNLVPVIPGPVLRTITTRNRAVHLFLLRTILGRTTRKLRGFVRAMVERHGLVFGDGETLRSTCEYLDLELEHPIIVPVPCTLRPANRKLGQEPRRGPLSFAWLGRLADFKIHILVYCLRKLSELAATSKCPIVAHIIGDGPARGRVTRLPVEHARFKLTMAGTVTGADLEDYLLRHVDVVLGMGTAALDAGALGVPTILVDMSYNPIPPSKHYRFRWLFEAEHYNLSGLIRPEMFEPENSSLMSVVKRLTREYASLSDRTFNYCVQHHGTPVVCDLLLKAAGEASFRFADFPPELIEKSVARRAYELLKCWQGKI